MLEWREHGVEMLAPPERVGFGRELIEKALTHTLQARTQLLFEPDGVVCRIILPSVAQRISAMSSPDHAHA
jgi:two-component system CheB/CheR fusion protein